MRHSAAGHPKSDCERGLPKQWNRICTIARRFLAQKPRSRPPWRAEDKTGDEQWKKLSFLAEVDFSERTWPRRSREAATKSKHAAAKTASTPGKKALSLRSW